MKKFTEIGIKIMPLLIGSALLISAPVNLQASGNDSLERKIGVVREESRPEINFYIIDQIDPILCDAIELTKRFYSERVGIDLKFNYVCPEEMEKIESNRFDQFKIVNNDFQTSRDLEMKEIMQKYNFNRELARLVYSQGGQETDTIKLNDLLSYIDRLEEYDLKLASIGILDLEVLL